MVLSNLIWQGSSKVVASSSLLGKSIQEWTKQILWKTAFKIFQGIWSASAKFCLPQNLLSPLLNTLSEITMALLRTIQYIFKSVRYDDMCLMKFQYFINKLKIAENYTCLAANKDIFHCVIYETKVMYPITSSFVIRFC